MQDYHLTNLNTRDESKTCALCKKNYVAEKGEICRHCQAEADDAFFRVREYLREHPTADALELSEQLVLDERIVLHLIDSGRLEMVNANISRCSVCGRAVIGMRLCMACRNNMSRSLDEARKALIARGAVDPETSAAQRGKEKEEEPYSRQSLYHRERQISTDYYKTMKKR